MLHAFVHVLYQSVTPVLLKMNKQHIKQTGFQSLQALSGDNAKKITKSASIKTLLPGVNFIMPGNRLRLVSEQSGKTFCSNRLSVLKKVFF